MTPPPSDTPRDVDASAPWLLILLSLLLAGPASAALRIRLAPEVVARCPSTDELTARWRTRAPAGDPAVELHIVAHGDGLVGIVRTEVPARRPPPAARRLRARRDGCSALADALLTAAALLTVPIELPPAPGRLPLAIAPPDSPSEPALTLPGEWHLTLGARGEIGVTPGPSAHGELALGHRIGSLTLGGGLHVGVMPATAVGAGQVRIERYAARFDGCWRPSSFGLCGFGRAGVLAIRPDGLDGADRAEALVDVGLRGALFLAATPSWVLVLDVEVAMPLRPLQLTVDGRDVWQASPAALGLGLAVEWSP